ncbi:ATP-binding protein [Bradyrhizobium sp. UFLA05-109]
MNQPESGEGPDSRSDFEKELAEVRRQRAAVSAVLRAIANSPHDLQPIFDTILDRAVHLCRAEWGSFRLSEEIGFRLVAYKVSPTFSELVSPPMLQRQDSFIGRLFASKSPVHIPDLAAEFRRLGEADRPVSLTKLDVGTCLFVPMLRNNEQIGTLGLVRYRIEPFTKNEIVLVTDFAAETAIALEITHRERQLRELQMQLAHANRVATMGQLTASIAHEVNQPITATIGNAEATLRWLARQPPRLDECQQLLARIIKDGQRANNVVGRIRDLTKKVPPRMERMEINGVIGEVIELTRGEAMKSSISVQTHFAEGLPVVKADRIQLQQVVLNLIINAVQALSDGGKGPRELAISTSISGPDGVLVSVRDSGPGISPENLERLFDAFYTTKPGGMGMGLSICRSIIEAHGGRIWATANVPHGAAFHVTIPTAPQCSEAG